MAQEQIAVTNNIVKLSFTLANLAASQDDTAIPRNANGNIFEALWDGYIVGMAAHLSTAKTAGALAVNPTIAGTAHSEGVTVGATATEWTALWEANAIPFSAGDSLGAAYTSDASFAPDGSMDVNVDLYVMFKDMTIYGA